MSIHSRTILAASLLVTGLGVLPTVGNTAVDPYPNGCVSCHVLDKSPHRGEWENAARALSGREGPARGGA